MQNKFSNKDFAFWIFICGVGELAGMAAASALYLLGWFMVGQSFSGLHGLVMLLIMLITGVAEGSIAGYFQWTALNRRFQKLSLERWIKATAWGTAVGCLLGSLPTLQLANYFQTHPGDLGIAKFLIAGLIGIILGGMIGLTQWWELKKYSLQSGYWILANALAWPLAIGFLYWGATQVACNLPAEINFSLGSVFGLCSGIAFGIISGLFLFLIQPSATPVNM
jgi:hypothetical protein